MRENQVFYVLYGDVRGWHKYICEHGSIENGYKKNRHSCAVVDGLVPVLGAGIPEQELCIFKNCYH